jgi:cytidylate kinase
MSDWKAVKGLQIAVDGPSGSGKGTVAANLAAEIGLPVLDTGLLYRFVATVALLRGVDMDDAGQLADLSAHLVPQMDWREDGIWFEGENYAERVRGEAAGAGASRVAACEAVRANLLPVQRNRAASGCIMDGRDIGSVVLPDAQAKFFLTASLRERARRRWSQYKDKNNSAELEQILIDLKMRDQRDAERQHAPLRQAADAIAIDSTTLRADEVVDRMLGVLERRRLITATV